MAATKADAKAEPTGGGGGGGGGSFTEERLSDKLDKLSSSAASIQSILF
jgi:regulator of Ty1 transposition protein 103